MSYFLIPFVLLLQDDSDVPTVIVLYVVLGTIWDMSR